MKKLLMFVLLLMIVVASLSLLGACGGDETDDKTYTKEGSGANPNFHNGDGGGITALVEVSVKNKVITEIKLVHDGSQGNYELWVPDGRLEYVNRFVGKTVKDVMALVATPATVEEGSNHFNGGSITGDMTNRVFAGATASSVAVVLAIQDAINQMPASVRA